MPVFDQSFRKYAGQRNLKTLWWPIASQLIRSQIKSKFLWVLTGFFVIYLVVVSFGFIASMLSNEIIGGGNGKEITGMARKNSLPLFDQNVNLGTILFRTMQPLYSLIWLMVLSVGAGSISSDKRNSAFPLYFSRPLRPYQYILGKILGVSLIPAVLLFSGMLIIAVQYIAYFQPLSAIPANIPPLLGSAAYIMIICTFAGLLITSISSLVKNSRNAGIIYLMVVYLTGVISERLRFTDQYAMYRVISPNTSLNRIGSFLMQPNFNEIRDPLATNSVSLTGAVLAVAIISAVCIYTLKRNVNVDQAVK